ncbi:hypothetical protein BDQ17DRAFT_1259637, partial [Cyathus striatus]
YLFIHCNFSLLQKSQPTHRISHYKLSTTTGILRRHLANIHLDHWIPACDQLKITIGRSAEINSLIDAHREKHNENPTAKASPKRQPFSKEAFVEALVDWVVSDDQSINVIENEKLRSLFLMLREDLTDEDIPHRTQLRNKIMETWDNHLNRLRDELTVSTLF